MQKIMSGAAQVESLEIRRMLAASVSLDGGVLTIKGDQASQVVEIHESHTANLRQVRVSLDATGNGSFTDRGDVNGAVFTGVHTIVARLGLGDDRLTITAVDTLDGLVRNYDLRTGDGNDVVRFTNPMGNDIRNSSLAITLDTAGGKDDVAFALNRISGSTLTANILTGAGDDALNIYAGDDVSYSTVRIDARLGDGHDNAQQRIDWEGFDLIGATSVWQVALHGEKGNDVLGVIGELGNASADVAGTLDLGLFGDEGNDQLAVALDRLTLRNGTLRVRSHGFAGNDRLSFSGNIGGAGTLDAILKGNGGDDTLSVNANSTVGSLLLDGGAGRDTATTQGTLVVQKVGIEV